MRIVTANFLRVGDGADMFFSMSKSRHEKGLNIISLFSPRVVASFMHINNLRDAKKSLEKNFAFLPDLMDSDTFHRHTIDIAILE